MSRLLFALLILLIFSSAWTPILSHNEARRMVVAREMVQNQNILLPTMNGELYVTKPPLYAWWQALMIRLLGDSKWVMRLPSHISALLILGLLYAWLKKDQNQDIAQWAVLILGNSYLFIFHARFAEIEIVLTLFSLIAVLSIKRFYQQKKRTDLWIAYASIGLGILTKGPVILLFFLPPLLVLSFQYSAARQALTDWIAWGIMVLIALPWFIWVYTHVPADLLHSILQQDMVNKIRGETDPLGYLKLIAANLLPWSWLFLRPACWFSIQDDRKEWLIWIIIPVLIFSFFSAQHGKYILPVFPLLAAYLALCLQDWIGQDRIKRIGAWSLGLFWLALLGLFHLYIAPRIWDHRYQNLSQIAQTIQTLHEPVYAYKRTMIQLIDYYGQPIPVRDRFENGRLFLVDSRDYNELPKNKCRLEQWQPYLKNKRQISLYRIGPCDTRHMNRQNGRPSQ